ncbi:hypothetical protein O9992_23770 [Vibrio lentus]|nr:hypothetical protein [Vibrio lentus]
MLRYVSPMAMTRGRCTRNTRTSNKSVYAQYRLAEELARDLDLDYSDLRFLRAGINHMAYYLTLENQKVVSTSIFIRILGFLRRIAAPKPGIYHSRCCNLVRCKDVQKIGLLRD